MPPFFVYTSKWEIVLLYAEVWSQTWISDFGWVKVMPFLTSMLQVGTVFHSGQVFTQTRPLTYLLFLHGANGLAIFLYR